MPNFPSYATHSNDPKWLPLNNHKTPWPWCGRSFGGVFGFGFDHPDNSTHRNRRPPSPKIRDAEDDKPGTKICIPGEGKFVKGLFRLHILGNDEVFSFGAWCSFAQGNVDAHVNISSTEAETELDPGFGWMISFPSYYKDREFLKSQVAFQDGSARPAVVIGDDTCSITDDQQKGISGETLLNTHAAARNDIRPHLERVTQ